MKIALKEDTTISIDVTFDGEDVFFHHILTGQKQEDLQQCFAGWSEKNPETDNKWTKLRALIEYHSDELWDFADEDDDLVLLGEEEILFTK